MREAFASLVHGFRGQAMAFDHHTRHPGTLYVNHGASAPDLFMMPPEIEIVSQLVNATENETRTDPKSAVAISLWQPLWREHDTNNLKDYFALANKVRTDG